MACRTANAWPAVTDTLNEQGLSVPKVGTRVNHLGAQSAGPKVQSVQFFPNPKLKKT
jgi:hypothetical protein